MNKKEFREIFKKFDRIKRDSWPGRLWIEVIFFGETNFFARRVEYRSRVSQI